MSLLVGGIRVNAIAPGAMVTDMNREVLEDREKMRRLEAAIPLGRLACPKKRLMRLSSQHLIRRAT
ncbi:MAG: SDR family oxidoreductase [Aigarchaeota archaeon]|nr:SDR family oxidoreductase [Candidatus Pelearchaeum maunauluense]